MLNVCDAATEDVSQPSHQVDRYRARSSFVAISCAETVGVARSGSELPLQAQKIRRKWEYVEAVS